MLHRYHVVATLALATLFSSSLSAGILLSCPDAISAVPVAGFANAESCGKSISTGPGSININVAPTGTIASDIELESWLGLAVNGLDRKVAPNTSVFAIGGSALLFPSIAANPGDVLQFDWTGSFEPGATGYLFYALDGALNILDYQVGNETTFPIGIPVDVISQLPTAALVAPHSISVPLAFGNHSLAFGVIVGSSLPVGNSTFFVDPTLDITNLRIAPAAVPEPGSIALMGLGLAALAIWRRKRA